MRIGIITTINTNIGDDFIRTGIENLISSVLDKPVIYRHVNKHFPLTAINKNSPPGLLFNLPLFKGKKRFENFYLKNCYSHFNDLNKQDIIIQSGAPVLWPNCYRNEWAQPIWYDTIGRLHKTTPTFNLAAGSCYPYEGQKKTFEDEQEAKFAKDIGSFCSLTTTRDRLAHSLFNSVSVDNTLLPCTAFFVQKSFENHIQGKYILVNYMKGGGHFDWDQNIDFHEWKRVMLKTIKNLKKFNEVRFICHNEAEIAFAKELDSGLKIHCPKTVDEYLNCVKNALVGINNRMHASVAMASVGVPSISICTDTRLLMLENLNLPVFYVKDINAELLTESVNTLIVNKAAERQKLFALKQSKFIEYTNLLKAFL